jgi:hypothetical protein
MRLVSRKGETNKTSETDFQDIVLTLSDLRNPSETE